MEGAEDDGAGRAWDAVVAGNVAIGDEFIEGGGAVLLWDADGAVQKGAGTMKGHELQHGVCQVAKKASFG